MFNKRYKLIFCTAVAILSLNACSNTTSEDKQLAVFSSTIEEFTNNIKEADTEINSLDITNKNSVNELLLILDDLGSEFSNLADVTVPEQYMNVKGLIADADKYMTQAVDYYHIAFGSEEFDEQYADVAFQNYQRAMIRVEYIGYLLAGKDIPIKDNVTVYEEDNDEKLLDKWLSDDESIPQNTETVNVDISTEF